jgi:hypothetical protein
VTELFWGFGGSVRFGGLLYGHILGQGKFNGKKNE